MLNHACRGSLVSMMHRVTWNIIQTNVHPSHKETQARGRVEVNQLNFAAVKMCQMPGFLVNILREIRGSYGN